MRIGKGSLCFVLAAAVLFAAESGYNLFQKGLAKERAEADLRGAVRIYEQVVRENAKDHKLAAQALFRIGECQQALGDKEAGRVYGRILRDYPDQNEIVAQAQARLAAMGRAPAAGSGISTRQVWTGPNVDIDGSISPDGRYLSFNYMAAFELGLHNFNTGSDRRLTAKDGSQKPFEHAEDSAISRDGKHVAYAWFNGERRYELRVLELRADSSAKPRVVYANEDVSFTSPLDWSPDGKWIAVALVRKDRTIQLGLVSSADGSLRVLKSVDWRGASNLSFSPDGQYLAYDLPAADGARQRDIFLMTADAGKEIPLLTSLANETVLAWTPDGKHLLFASDLSGTRSIWAVPVSDGRKQETPVLIKADIGNASRSLGLSRSGTLYLGLELGGEDVQIASLDFQTGKLLAAPAKPIQQFVGFNSLPRFSPDGKYLVYRRTQRSGPRTVVGIRSLETGQVRELASDISYFNQIDWAPDGRSLAVRGRDAKARQGIYRVDIQSGEIAPLVLEEPTVQVMRPMWAPDGKTLYYRRADANGQAIIGRDISTGKEREIYRGPMSRPSLSPNGRQFVIIDGNGRLLVIPVEGGSAREIMKFQKSDGVMQIEWTPDGNSIVASKPTPGGSATGGLELWRIPLSGGSPQRLEVNTLSASGEFTIHPDGQRIAFTSGEPKNEVWAIENFLPMLQVKR